MNVDFDPWYKEDMSKPSSIQPDAPHGLQVLAERASLNVRSYSGRYMHGRVCLGIVAEGAGEVFAAIVGELRDVDANKEGEVFDEVQSAFEDMKTDRLYDKIVVYFPSVHFYVAPQDAEKEEDEETEAG